jgi:hypothetical protein
MPKGGYPRPDPRDHHHAIALNPAAVASALLVVAAIAIVLLLTYL